MNYKFETIMTWITYVRNGIWEVEKKNDCVEDPECIRSRFEDLFFNVFVEKLDVAVGETVKFDQVLAVVDGETATFGAPVIEGASVSANVVKNGKSAKVRVYKMKPKKGYRRTQGHRQPYTKVQIEAINA